eukprot:TRINITY_DN21627_c0_g1_i1.p1 TRINITY_DN21627_c0_g1~~TRINITY_DN21627_c0_g1_i1.p1  ORF type:complete len:503 (-),score=170.29 TRINITY_DN21627_c0_g1_i1:62-1516(-)
MVAAHGSLTHGDLESWKRLFESEKADLARSERVQQQLKQVLLPLQQRCNELAAENKRLRAEAAATSPEVAACEALEREIKVAEQDLESLQSRQSHVANEIKEQLKAKEASRAREEQCRANIDAAIKAAAELVELRSEAEAKYQETQNKGRSMVTDEALERARGDAQRLSEQLEKQEAEAARLRQALADSWASRNDDSDEAGLGQDSHEDPMKALENVEEELKWLAQTQRETSAEVHRLQSLERSEAALQAKLRQASEEKAALQSARVDLGDAGRAMREAVASQSEAYIRRVGGLEAARKNADGDRIKLIQECADLQAQLDAMAPKLAGIADTEGRHAKLEAARAGLADESQRLRDVNGALGAMLLGEEGLSSDPQSEGDSGGGVSESVMRVLQLQCRLRERQEAQDSEREKMDKRIKELEKAAAQPDRQPAPATQSSRRGCGAASAPAGRKGPEPNAPGGAFASATSVLRGGFGRLREVTMSGI